ncbi:MAG: hypothetical protein ACQKBU_02150, partial [Verrucomicrobiales bacterium]
GEWEWVDRAYPLAVRERFWLSFSFFEIGEAEKGNALIRNTDATQNDFVGDSTFNIFSTNIAVVLALRYMHLFDADVRDKLFGMIREGFSTWEGNRAPDYQFHGYNDNMPAKACMGLVLGGELLGNQQAIDHGYWSLRQFGDQLSRRGINSEYNSPTYSPLTLHAMAEIGERSQSEEIRGLARQIEFRLWLDLAARFHPETGMLAGPYSRAYTVDLLGHISVASSLLWFVLGKVSRMSPMRLFDETNDLVLHHRGNRPFNIAQMCWLAIGEYHLPEEVRALFTGKSYPHRTVATAEMGYLENGYPACPVRTETFLERDYTVGTANVSFLNGVQSASYFSTYRRVRGHSEGEDAGTVYAKVLEGDEVPGEVLKEHPEFDNADENSNLASHGNVYTMQSDATVMALTAFQREKSELAGDSDVSLCVIFSSRSGGADEVICGSNRRDGWEGLVDKGEWIVCRRGKLLIGIRPLVYSLGEESLILSLEKENHYEWIRMKFQGNGARGSRDGLMGGFLAEHASVDEYTSLEEFANVLQRSIVSDYFWSTRRVHYLRGKSKARHELEMEISWTPGSPVPRFAEINGVPVDWPKWQSDEPAPSPQTIPLLGKRKSREPPFFPWEHLRCVQLDWPWGIGDRAEESGTFREPG